MVNCTEEKPIMQWLKGAIQEKDWSKFIPDFASLEERYQIAFLRTIMEWHKYGYKKISGDDLKRLVAAPERININVYFVIKILLHLIEYKVFPNWTELYGFLKESSPYNNNRKILSLDIGSQLFDRCKGRMSLGYLHNPDGNDPLFTIEIQPDYSSNIYINKSRRNNDFKDRVSLIKQLFPQRKYNSEIKSWIIPDHSYRLVIEFAQTYDAELVWLGENIRTREVKQDDNMQDNDKISIGETLTSYHFYKNRRSYIPWLCEGRRGEIRSKKLPCWWCYGTSCYANNIHQHKDDIDEYTLYDFIYILNLQESMRCPDTKGYIIPNGNYIKLMSTLNWINQAQSHLYCKECGRILEPSDVSSYHAHTITEFICRNISCSQKDVRIYLNHCFNSNCQNIIDSRETKQCPNGKYICKKCGICCSNYMFRNRPNAGPLRIPHWENLEFYCPICGAKLRQTNIDNKYEKYKYECQNDDYMIMVDLSEEQKNYSKSLVEYGMRERANARIKKLIEEFGMNGKLF